VAVTNADECPLMHSEGVADAGDMAGDASKTERAERVGLGGDSVAREREGASGRPSHLRLVATVSADTVALVVASFAGLWLAGVLDDMPIVGRLASPFEAVPRGGPLLILIVTPVCLAALWAFGMYRAPVRGIGGVQLTEGLGGLTALTVASWVVLIGLVLVGGHNAPVGALIAMWFVAIILVPLGRWIGRLLLWSRESFQERVVIVGAGEVGHTVAAKIGKHPDYRIRLVGFLDDGEPRRNGHGGANTPLIGALGDLEQVIAERHIDRVIVAFSKARHNDFLRIVRACSDTGVQVNVVPRLFEVVSSRALVDDVEGIPLLDIGHVELSRFNMGVKRAFDLLVGGVLCLFMVPVIAVLGVLIKLDSRGPVFFRQERMGRHGKTFMILKLRTMSVDADQLLLDLVGKSDYDGPCFKMHHDPRMTRVGVLLRRWSLDELPQILNVMKGDMSLVGPRPLWVEEARQCRGWTQKRLDITPGMTGLWQVLGRSDIAFDEMVKLDYMYVASWSLSWDLKLLLQTLPAVLHKRGAY
jgi:exopolysaccharide biosynthesis polyprenyl glycosylphosphotransferase